MDSQTNLQKFTVMIHSIEEDDGKELEDVACRIQKMFDDHGDEQMLWDFFEAFTSVVLEGDLVRKEKPVAPFVYLLSRIPEPFKTRARDALIQKILKFLTIKRPADCVRAEFFAHAEAFAALVKLEFVSIKGAITTINTLLKKEDNRCAALTMLGKTVELCLDILTEKCDPSVLRDLRGTLDSIVDPAFEYDIAYIKENMSWQDGGVGDGVKPAALMPHRSFEGHRNVIFSLAYDPSRDVLVSASKDGRVITWSAEGKQQDLIELPRHYACSMDINPKQRILYMCGVSKETQGASAKDAHPAVIAYVQTDHGKWQQHGILEKQDTKVISSVKASLWGAGNQFVTGETMKDSANEFTRSVVCCYDLHGAIGGAFETLKPVMVFAEHQDIITCMAAVPRLEHTFLSGGRDCRVLLWDVRMPKSVGMLLGHEGTVTSVSAFDNLVVTGGLDKKVMSFDIRLLTAPSHQIRPMNTMVLDESAVLKVSLGSSAEAAASTLLGLYQINLASNESRQVQGFADPANPSAAKATRYHDLVWNRDHSVLYAAGDDMRIDVYVKGGGELGGPR
eukprot:EG_transcript_6378